MSDINNAYEMLSNGVPYSSQEFDKFRDNEKLFVAALQKDKFNLLYGVDKYKYDPKYCSKVIDLFAPPSLNNEFLKGFWPKLQSGEIPANKDFLKNVYVFCDYDNLKYFPSELKKDLEFLKEINVQDIGLTHVDKSVLNDKGFIDYMLEKENFFKTGHDPVSLEYITLGDKIKNDRDYMASMVFTNMYAYKLLPDHLKQDKDFFEITFDDRLRAMKGVGAYDVNMRDDFLKLNIPDSGKSDPEFALKIVKILSKYEDGNKKLSLPKNTFNDEIQKLIDGKKINDAINNLQSEIDDRKVKQNVEKPKLKNFKVRL